MPIEIKELIVRVVIQDKPPMPVPLHNQLPAISMKKIVDQCVEKVLEKLEAKSER